MKRRIGFLVGIYCWFFIMFVVQKPLFMLYHWDLYGGTPLSQWLAVMWHGRGLDLSMAAYLTVLPALFTAATACLRGAWWKPVFRIYFVLIAVVVSAITLGDAVLYSFWGFRIDATPLFYLASPADAGLADGGDSVAHRVLCAAARVALVALVGADSAVGKTTQALAIAGCIVAAYGGPVYPHTGRVHGLDHECGQSLFQ